MESTVYNQKGAEIGKVSLPDHVFGVKWNSNLVHQVVTALMMDSRSAIAHTKDRGEVRGGGKKPWKQKGTGRARHGSSRSPIWVGGGVAHGPRNEKNFSRKINKKMKTKALFAILSRKLRDNEVLFVDKFDLKEAKTREAREVLKSLSTISGFNILGKKANSAYFALGEKNLATEKGFRNFNNLELSEARSLNPVDIMNYKYIVITHPEASVKMLAEKLGVKAEGSAVPAKVKAAKAPKAAKPAAKKKAAPKAKAK